MEKKLQKVELKKTCYTSAILSEFDRDSFKIDYYLLTKTYLTLRAIRNPARIRILQFIHEQHEIHVTGIYIHLRLEQSVASQHLSILRKAGFVKFKRHGKTLFYSLNYKRFQELKDFMSFLCA
jgi:DNA-binding transcriptional ArsR family regulator